MASNNNEIQVNYNQEFPFIALKNVVLFPHVAMPLQVQRSKSIDSLDFAMAKDRLVVFVAQKNTYDDVKVKDLFRVGTIGKILDVQKLPEGFFQVEVEGLARVTVEDFTQTDPFFKVRVSPLKLEPDTTVEVEVLMRSAIDQFRKVVEARTLPGALTGGLVNLLNRIKDAEQIVNLIAMHLNLELKDQQSILEAASIKDALKRINLFITRETEIIDTEKRVFKETKKQINKLQKEMFLREQMKSIEKELGIQDEKNEFDTLRAKIKAAGMPRDVEAKALKELDRLEKMPSFSPEVSYLRTYLDLLVDLPWNKKSTSKIELKAAEKVLNEDHYGLEKVKERILEYLAVQKQVGKIKGPILCFFGPPGTGKTSIGRSIAKAMGREFIRVSLGGLHDEAEIRGHRRTYVGAMPGRIIQSIQSVKSKNPVFMLDEIDKVGTDFRGDPSAALLEALDPEQNSTFSDNYLEVPFDLSDVLFITTANMMDTIPPALRDRLEIIEFPGYTEEEKLHIAKQYLIHKLYEQHGLKKAGNVSFADDALRDIIRKHTREAGVRDLERQVAKILRKVIRSTVENKTKGKIKIDAKSLHAYLGPMKYSHQESEKKNEIGVATGLAWTPVGGEILAIESSSMPGKGKLIPTGQLGEVMKESIQIALSYARSKAAMLGINTEFYKEDIHVHVPSGAIPKDGPSAGVAMATSIISLLTRIPVRKDVGMTGEITLRGHVLEIGGFKEKVLAAHRAGLKLVIAPEQNRKDLADIPKEISKDLKFEFVKNMDQVLSLAMARKQVNDKTRTNKVRLTPIRGKFSTPASPKQA